MINTQVLKGNLIRQDYTTAFALNQGDKGVPFKIELLENGAPYILQSTDIVTIEWLKPNGSPFLQDTGITKGDTYVEITTPEAISQSSGSGTFNIIISNNNVRKGTIRREYKVVPTSMKPGSISEDVITDAITELRNLNTELAEKVQNNQEIINSNSAATKTDIANVNSSLEDIENNKSNKDEVEVALNNKISKQETIDLLSNIGTMSPKGVYSNLTALKEDKPNGDTGIYLTDDNDSWNYWNGSDWIIGGVYQKTVIDDNSLTVDKIKTPLQYGIITHGTFNIDTSNGTITPMLESGMSVFVMTVPTRGVVTMELTNNSPINISISSLRINLIYYDITSKTLKVDTQPTTILNYSSNLIFLGAFFNNVFHGELNKNKFKINNYYQQDNNLAYLFNGFINYNTSTQTLSIEGNRHFTGNAWLYTTNTQNIELSGTETVTIDTTDMIRHIYYDLQTNSLLLQTTNDVPRDNKNKLYICSVYNNKILNGVNNDAYKINGIEINKHSYGTASVGLGTINIDTVHKKLEFTNCGFGFYIASSLGQFNYSSNADDIPDVPIEIDNNRFNTIFYDTETNTFTVSVFRTKKTQLSICTFYDNKIIFGDSKNITINNFGPIYSSILSNKKIVCIGDSMTRGYTLPIEKSWVNLIGMRNGSSTINMGISGCCMTATKSPGATVEQSIIRRLSLIDKNADYILVYGGYNDAFLNVTLGNKNSRNETEFYGALNLAIEYLQTNFPTAKIGFITPYKFQDKFQTYIDAIVEKCEENNIPVLKNHLVGGINYKNPKHVEVLTMGDVHLSEIGLEKVSYTIENFIKSI